MTMYGWLALNAFLCALNFAFFWWWAPRWLRWFSFASGCCCLLVTILNVAIVYDATFGECANQPKDVPFHQGMTLCPGQTAHGTLNLLDAR